VLALSDQGQKLEWFATLRGRLGATVTPRCSCLCHRRAGRRRDHDRRHRVRHRRQRQARQYHRQQPQHQGGGTVGGGIEGRLAGNWTARLEYLYLDLGTVSTVPTPAANATVATAFNSRVTGNIVRAGLNYKFGTLAGIWASD
jgi:opacity protein-like surface antigen